MGHYYIDILFNSYDKKLQYKLWQTTVLISQSSIPKAQLAKCMSLDKNA